MARWYFLIVGIFFALLAVYDLVAGNWVYALIELFGASLSYVALVIERGPSDA